jgi:diaminopimelate epimerase
MALHGISSHDRQVVVDDQKVTVEMPEASRKPFHISFATQNVDGPFTGTAKPQPTGLSLAFSSIPHLLLFAGSNR